MAGDWLKLHRKLVESQVFSDPITLRLWIFLLIRANFRPSFFRGERVEVGQVAFSHRALSASLDLAIATLGRHLKRLEKWGQISLKAGRDFSIITICNWETYQNADAEDGTPASTPTSTPAVRKRYAGEHVPKKERSLRREETKKSGGDEPDELKPKIPDELATPELVAAVENWMRYKSERRESYTPTGLKMFYARLANEVTRIGQKPIIEKLERAMSQNWRGWDFKGDDGRAPASANGSSHAKPARSISMWDAIGEKPPR